MRLAMKVEIPTSRWRRWLYEVDGLPRILLLILMRCPGISALRFWMGETLARRAHPAHLVETNPGHISLNMAFTGCVQCVNRYHGHMSGVVAIARRVVECASRLMAPPSAAIMGIILLLDRIFDVFLGTGAPANAAVQRLVGVPAGRSRSLESDTADAQHVTTATPNREPVIVHAELVEEDSGRVMRPTGSMLPELVHVTVQRSDGVYAGANEAWEQSRSLGPGDGDGKGLRYESDYRPGPVGANTVGTVRVKHRER
jgi:hypothetical protein